MWVLITICAAAFQTSRTLVQHRLRRLLSVSGAGFVRYVYGAPIALGAVGIAALAGADLPRIPAEFWPWITLGGVAQIVGTICLISAFDARDFAAGTVFSKTEVVQVAVLSAIVAGEGLSWLGWLGALVCLSGVVALAAAGANWRQVLAAGRDRAAWWGIGAGCFLGLAAIAIRQASSTMGDGPALWRALVALAAMNTIQTVVHGGYLATRDRSQIRLALVHWRSSGIVGVLSVCGSACWALALTLQEAPKVRTLGQIELIVAFVASRRFLDERHGRRDIAASAIVVAGILVVLLLG
jgi:drug/metabolite transporter (DMT)-like permease